MKWSDKILETVQEDLHGQTVMHPVQKMIDQGFIKNDDEFQELIVAAQLETCEGCSWYHKVEEMIVDEMEFYCDECKPMEDEDDGQ